ncbi:MBL fold metallo-hydrolase [Nitrospiraceae bacterium AH_259_D15_M11_P09]|nr:MBL fold metallo-hydrolase [Nitrospiraceae bacterium AH_259_D15_M11_P09]
MSSPTLVAEQEVQQNDSWNYLGAPKGFIVPPLHPGGVQLKPLQLAEGVYALLSNTGVVDNNGFIVGERGVLVIDAHINGVMAQQIIDAVEQVTSKPILYLVNTNYHGDHTFGNYKFPLTTTVIAHRETAQQMQYFERAKLLMLQAVRGDESVLSDVKLRLPDMVIDRSIRIDLGGRAVELRHLGGGNTNGDVVVYEPDSRVAWTGNLVIGAGTIPGMFQNGAVTYLNTLTNLRSTLDVETIVPGHGAITDRTTLTRYLQYAGELTDTVRAARRAGRTIDQVLEETPLWVQYLPPADSPLAAFTPVLQGFHRMNLLKTYQEEAARRP